MTASEPTRPRLLNRAALALTVLLLLAGVGAAVALSRGRAFQIDEVEHLHTAFNLRRGEELYRDFWEGHNPLLYVLLYPLARVDDPVATYRLARWLSLICLLSTVLTASWCSGRLGGRHAALLTGGLLILHSTMVERGIEVRPDGWLALLGVSALALELSGATRLRRSCLQAAVLGLAFLFTQKAIIVCVGFGALWLWTAIRQRRPGLVALPMVVWTIPVALTLGLLWWRGSLEAYLEYNVMAQARHVTRTAGHHGSFSPWEAIFAESSRNLLFAGLALPAAAGALFRRGPTAFAASLALLGLLYLQVNPFPFPYAHVAVLPFFAIVIGVALARVWKHLDRRGTGLAGLATTACLVLAGTTSIPRLAGKAASGNESQLHVLREIQRVTEPDDAVFDLAGLYARPDAYPVFTMTGVMLERYRNGVFPRMIPSWRERGLVAMIENYRIHWLRSPEIEFLGANMVYWGSNIYVSGAGIRDLLPEDEQRFEVLKTNRYRYDGPGRLLVDGKPMTVRVLVPGEHVLSSPTGISAGRLILDVPASPDAESSRPLFPRFD